MQMLLPNVMNIIGLLVFIGLLILMYVLVSRQPGGKKDKSLATVKPLHKNDIMKRAQALVSLLLRSKFELALLNTDITDEQVKEYKKINAQLEEWIAQEKLQKIFTSSERKLLEKQLGEWSEEEMDFAQHNAEALGCIAWYLSVFPILAEYDAEFDHEKITKAVKALKPLHELAKEAKLRPKRDIQKAFLIATVYYKRMELDETETDAISELASENYKKHLTPPPQENDIPAFGNAIKNLSEEEQNQLRITATSRYHAFKWLLGKSKEWGE